MYAEDLWYYFPRPSASAVSARCGLVVLLSLDIRPRWLVLGADSWYYTFPRPSASVVSAGCGLVVLLSLGLRPRWLVLGADSWYYTFPRPSASAVSAGCGLVVLLSLGLRPRWLVLGADSWYYFLSAFGLVGQCWVQTRGISFPRPSASAVSAGCRLVVLLSLGLRPRRSVLGVEP